MPKRQIVFSTGEYYHCYNRGVDKRTVFEDKQDFTYFLRALISYNDVSTYGKLRLSQFELINRTPIVSIHAYCLNPNHFHILLSEKTDYGISNFMQRLGTSYTKYFNEKHARSGSLFQGRFKAKHIHVDTSLQHITAYINLNNEVHGIFNKHKFRSSYEEYISPAIPHEVLSPASNFSNICSEYEFIRDAHDSYGNFAKDAINYTKQLRSNYKKSESSEFLE